MHLQRVTLNQLCNVICFPKKSEYYTFLHRGKLKNLSLRYNNVFLIVFFCVFSRYPKSVSIICVNRTLWDENLSDQDLTLCELVFNVQVHYSVLLESFSFKAETSVLNWHWTDFFPLWTTIFRYLTPFWKTNLRTIYLKPQVVHLRGRGRGARVEFKRC